MKKVFSINYSKIDSYIQNELQYEIHDNYLPINEQHLDYGIISNAINPTDEILQDKIRKIILSKQLDEVEVYKKADVDRKLFSKIRTLPDYHPNKNTLVKLCLSMQLDIEEAESLLETAGYSLSRSIKTDLILRYCFQNKIFDVITVNEILDHYEEKII